MSLSPIWNGSIHSAWISYGVSPHREFSTLDSLPVVKVLFEHFDEHNSKLSQSYDRSLIIFLAIISHIMYLPHRRPIIEVVPT